MSLGSTTERMSLSLLLYPTPVGTGMYSSLKTPVQDPILHVLSRITGSFAESRLSLGQRIPQTYLQLNIWGTSSGDVSGDGLTSHKTSTSSLICTPGEMAPDPSSSFWVAHQEHDASRHSRTWRRMKTLLAIESSMTLISWPLANLMSSSSHVSHYKLCYWW